MNSDCIPVLDLELVEEEKSAHHQKTSKLLFLREEQHA